MPNMKKFDWNGFEDCLIHPEYPSKSVILAVLIKYLKIGIFFFWKIVIGRFEGLSHLVLLQVTNVTDHTDLIAPD